MKTILITIILILTAQLFVNIWHYKSQLRTESIITYLKNDVMKFEKLELGSLDITRLKIGE